MRIGIDGRWLHAGNPSGRVEVANLLQQWLLSQSEHEFFVFLRRCDRGLPFPFPSPRVHLLPVAGRIGLWRNCLFLPWRARKLGLNVCLFFNFSPPAGRFAKVVLINDIIFKAFPGYFTWRERLYFWPMRWLSRYADRICTLSLSEKERMIRCGYADADRLAVVPLGVDKCFLPLSGHDPRRMREIRAKYRLPERFLLYVGRLNERKNILNLLKAVAVLEDRAITLVLAGSPDWKMFDLAAKIDELGLAGRVVLIGHVTQADLPVLYAAAAVFCYVSYAEGFGLPPLEAMASGVPVVVSDRDSLPEVCADAGSFVDPEDPDAIAAAIDRLLRDPEFRAEMRAKGLRRAGHFSWKESADQLLRVCCEVAR